VPFGGEHVKTQTTLVNVIALCLGALPAAAICQAGAEYSANTAATASATAKAGWGVNSSLDSIAGKAVQQLGGRPAERVARPAMQRREAGRVPRRVSGMRPVPANTGPARQMRSGFARHDAAARAVAGTCAAVPVNALPGDKANAACKPDAPVEYPSVLNLSFPKE
jgi:hypothetical protein